MVYILDKPGPVRDLQVKDVLAENMTLTWKIPEDNGGSSIHAYIVEKREENRRMWQEAGESVILEHVVENLREGNKYLFQVAAKNKYGLGDFVEIPKPVLAKHPFGM